MLKNYLTIILRKLRKERLYTIVNLSGLSVGLCAFLLILLFVRDELSFDEFHEDKANIYRVLSNDQRFGYGASIACDYLKLVADDLPQVNSYTRISTLGGQVLLETKAQRTYITQAYYVDKNFFSFFDFELINGVAEDVLDGPDYAVISESLAQRVFGEENPVGKTLLLNKQLSVFVNGVAKGAPANSSVKFDLLITEAGKMDNQFEERGLLGLATTYVNINPLIAPEVVADRLTALKERSPYRMFLEEMAYELLPLTEQRLTPLYESDTFAKNDIRFIYLLSGIGLVILFLALMNYINLTTAQSIRRSAELGLRKVIGASRKQLLGYQLLESTVVTTIALAIAFALAERLMPVYNGLLNKGIVLSYNSPGFLVGVPLFGLILGLLAGAYPAITISRVKPLRLVNRQLTNTGGNKNLRRVLVLTQFMVAGGLLLTTLIMQSQMNYMKTKDLGFEKEHLVTLPLYGDSTAAVILRQEVAQVAGVKDLSLSSWKMGRGYTTQAFNDNFEEKEDALRTRVEYIRSDENYVKTMGLRITNASDSYKEYGLREDEVVISQALANEFNWTSEPLGKQVFTYDKKPRTVVAVVADFHSRALKSQLMPSLIMLNGDASFDYLEVRLEGAFHGNVLSDIRPLYEETLERPFQYFFVDDEAARYYETELGQLRLFSIFSSLAVFIALIGLAALTTYMTQQRQKEVSIRKVLGASVKELLLMLNKEHTWLTLIAFAIATPVAVYAMQEWLANFKYHISLKPTLFITAVLGFVALNILITLVYTLRVSRANPAHTLRNE